MDLTLCQPPLRVRPTYPHPCRALDRPPRVWGEAPQTPPSCCCARPYCRPKTGPWGQVSLFRHPSRSFPTSQGLHPQEGLGTVLGTARTSQERQVSGWGQTEGEVNVPSQKTLQLEARRNSSAIILVFLSPLIRRRCKFNSVGVCRAQMQSRGRQMPVFCSPCSLWVPTKIDWQVLSKGWG